MAMKLFNNSIYLFESSEVKVFPCSYRGEFEDSIVDPEARMLTERNFRVTNEKENRSYIDAINLNDFDLKGLNLNIDGYYFRINCSENLSTYINGGYDTFVISLGDITSGGVITPILKPVYNSNNQDLKLDFKDPTNGKYYFTGLGLVKSSEDTYSGNIKLKVAVYTTDPTPNTKVDKDALLSGLSIYQANDFTYRLIGQQGENAREVKLTLKSGTDTDQIVTTEQTQIITADKTFKGNVTINGTGKSLSVTNANITNITNDPLLAKTKEIKRTMKKISDPNDTDYVAREVVVPDYNDAQANNVLSVNASGTGLEWRIPYTNALEDGE